MSSKIENLHSSIRRYCMERYSYWTKKYGELVSAGKDRLGSEYTKEALYTFPRYNALNAMLVEVERHRPVDFTSLNEAWRVFKAHSQGCSPRVDRFFVETKCWPRAAVGSTVGR